MQYFFVTNELYLASRGEPYMTLSAGDRVKIAGFIYWLAFRVMATVLFSLESVRYSIICWQPAEEMYGLEIG
jgi:hypothetical protein